MDILLQMSIKKFFFLVFYIPYVTKKMIRECTNISIFYDFLFKYGYAR